MKYYTFLLLIPLLFFSCESNDHSVVKEQIESDAEFLDERNISYEVSTDYGEVPPPPVMEIKESNLIDPLQPNTPKSYLSQRKLIKTGSIEIVPTSIEESQKEIFALVNSYGGYISNQQQKQRNDFTSVELEIKIPSLQFDDFYSDVLEMEGEISNQHIRVNDVTEEFVDVQSRIQTKKEVESRYRELLKRAKNIKEVLNVERELGDLRTEIESYEGRLKFLKNRTNFSTMSIELNEIVTPEPIKNGFGMQLLKAFGTGGDIIKAITLGLVSIWPILLLLPLIYFMIRRFRFSKSRVIE